MPSWPAEGVPVRGSVLTPRAGRVEDFAGDGTARVRKMFTGQKGTFRIRMLLTAAELATVRAFCDANEIATFDFTWAEDGNTYQVKIAGDGLRVTLRDGAGDLRDAEIDLVIVE